MTITIADIRDGLNNVWLRDIPFDQIKLYFSVDFHQEFMQLMRDLCRPIEKAGTFDGVKIAVDYDLLYGWYIK